MNMNNILCTFKVYIVYPVFLIAVVGARVQVGDCFQKVVATLNFTSHVKTTKQKRVVETTAPISTFHYTHKHNPLIVGPFLDGCLRLFPF